MSAEMLAYLAARHEAFSADLDRDANPDLPSAARMRSAGAAAVLADLRGRYDPEYRRDEARYIADEGYCEECGYLISVHQEDEPCPTETVAMERWGADR